MKVLANKEESSRSRRFVAARERTAPALGATRPASRRRTPRGAPGRPPRLPAEVGRGSIQKIS